MTDDFGAKEVLNTRRATWIVWGLLVPIHLLLLGWLACRYSPTSDEIAHFAAGVRLWTTGKFDLYPVNPPLVKLVATLPVVVDPPRTDWHQLTAEPGDRPEWRVGQDLMAANVPRFRWDFVIARWVCLPFSVIGLIYCYRWANEIFGPASGVVAAILWCFSPNILGNGALITPDVPASALGLASLFHFRRWLQTGRWFDAALAGLVLGLVQLTKMTWLLLYLLLPVMWLSCWWFRRQHPAEDSLLRSTGQLLLIFVISLDVLNAGYLFENSGRPLGDFHFVSHSLSGEIDTALTGNRFAGTPFAHLPVPLPASFVTGIDLQRRDFEGRWQPLSSYLRGQQRHGGWWYYYLYALLIKVPLGFLGVAACSLVSVVPFRWNRGFPRTRDILFLLFPAVALFLFVSSQTGFSRYFRYALPCLPFFFIAISSVWATPIDRFRWLRVAATSVLLAGVGESLAVYPDSLGFFNSAIGGPAQGHHHLLDSNIDWGQDLYALRDWQQLHPHAQPLYLAYSGVANPDLFQLSRQDLPDSPSQSNAPFPAGWYAISVNRLHGYDGPESGWQKFLTRPVIDRVGSSILIYHLSVETTE